MVQRINKVLITGSSGMIGTRLFETLSAQGYRVTGFDKKPNRWRPELNQKTIIGDLLEKKDVNALPDDFDLVIHLAANARVYDLVVQPDLAMENIATTYNILNFIRERRIKNVIFSSSREVYSNRKTAVAREEDVNVHLCESAYAASKVSDEALVYSFSKCYGIDYIVCRFSNVYGMYDDSNRFIPLMIQKMKKDEDVEIYGQDKVLDFTYIDDCVAGVTACIKKFPRAKNTTLNIAYGRGEKLTDVAMLIKKAMGSKSNIVIKKNRPGEVVKFIANISKAKTVIAFDPRHSIERGLEKTVRWYAAGE